MPSPHSSPETQADARTIAANLGAELIEIPIASAMAEYETALAAAFDVSGDDGAEPLPRDPARPSEPDLAAENIQARIRGNMMMALSNEHGWLVLTTGNKSEMSVGYATLYGDMAGGFAVIKDVPKGLVYELVSRRNERRRRVRHFPEPSVHLLVRRPVGGCENRDTKQLRADGGGPLLIALFSTRAVCRCLTAAAQPKLGEDVADVMLDGLAADEQPLRYLRIRQPVADQIEDLGLAFRELPPAALHRASASRSRPDSERAQHSRGLICVTSRLQSFERLERGARL